jgi:CRP-like cAMP-binding protein
MISPELLRRFNLFAGLDPAIFKEIAMMADEVAVQKGDWLYTEGEHADSLYLIVSGTVELTINLDNKGTRHTELSRLVEGDVTGPSALLEPYVYTMGAVADTDGKVARIDAQALRELMHKKPEIGYTIMRGLAQALAQRLTDLRVRFVSLTEA